MIHVYREIISRTTTTAQHSNNTATQQTVLYTSLPDQLLPVPKKLITTEEMQCKKTRRKNQQRLIDCPCLESVLALAGDLSPGR
jgi:hypothetical protein